MLTLWSTRGGGGFQTKNYIYPVLEVYTVSTTPFILYFNHEHSSFSMSTAYITLYICKDSFDCPLPVIFGW